MNSDWLRIQRVVCIGVAIAWFAGLPVPVHAVDRATNGLQSLYDFTEARGNVVRDRSGVGQPIDLTITNTKAVKWSKGALEVHGKTSIQSKGPASKLITAISKSNELTIEAWLRPANTKQNGPARIVTISKNTSFRNVTLGQEADRYDARLRTTKTSSNGMPSIMTGSKTVSTKPTHLVYTRDRNGKARLYINGKQQTEKTVSGSMSNWDRSQRLGLANEFSGDRQWQGTLYLVAIYDKALGSKEIEQNLKAGVDAVSAVVIREPPKPPSKAVAARHFDKHIAPLLAKRCLDCHGWKSTKARLDLSQQRTALAGGKNGKAIVPGDAAVSLLWKSVEDDDMPEKGPPLTSREKNLLRDWIRDGAVWSRDRLDKATFVPEVSGGANWLRRLTVKEYIETVKHAVGVDVAKEAKQLLPRDLRADGFSNTAYNLSVDLAHVEAYAKLAGLVVERMNVAQFTNQFAGERVGKRDLSPASLRAFVSSVGKWLLRGPLDEHELKLYIGVANAVAKEGGDFYEAASYVIEAMLQAPRFIYRMEQQVGGGEAKPVGPYELASRLSYILWGGPPDHALMQAAASGELASRAGVAKQVQRMVSSPRAIERSNDFIYEWLDLGRLDHLRPSTKHFPKWNPQLAADMRAETLAFFNDVVWKQKRPMADLFNAQLTHVTPKLATHYGLPPKGTSQVRYDLSRVPARGGLLTQGSVLTIGGDEASTVTRGLFVLHDVLRGHVEDPPPGLDTTPVPSSPGLSNRRIAEIRIMDNSCGGCHKKFEPLSFALEKFDGLGSFIEKDKHGNSMREDGEILFPRSDKPIPFKTSAELMNLLANSDRVKETLTWKVTQWALGRPIVDADKAELGKIHTAAQRNGGTYASVITAIVMSDLVLKTRTETKP